MSRPDLTVCLDESCRSPSVASLAGNDGRVTLHPHVRAWACPRCGFVLRIGDLAARRSTACPACAPTG
ncbi:MAG TPA: hypothetical protein VM681_10435 [Candidatus Thermoplasmatota archaeon]|nr:hypothetical protein [Candidatus Thermoplasmatota archaeon]